MTENKRFTTDNGSNEDVCLVDNLTGKEYEDNFDDIVDLMNKLCEQTLRFDKYNDEKLEELRKIDNIVTKTNLGDHGECWNALRRIDNITNGYGDVE